MRGNAQSRQAESFNALLAGDTAPSAQQSELLAVVAALRTTPPVEARPEFVASLRTQLVAAAHREPARAEEELALRLTPRQRRGSRDRKLAAAIGGFALVAASGSMAMAAQSALPGDVLYPVKRAIENAETNLKSDSASKADSMIAHAESRLHEAEKLTARGAAAGVIAESLDDFGVQAEQAAEFTLGDFAATGDERTIVTLRAFVSSSMDALGALGPVVPDSVRPSLVTAGQTIRQIDLTAWEACPTCAGGGVAEIPVFAAQPVSLALLGGAPQSAASVTRPGQGLPEPAPSVGPSDLPTGIPTTPASPTEPDATTPPSSTSTEKSSPTGKNPPTSVAGTVKETIEDVTTGLSEGLLGTAQESSSGGGLAGILVDGVAGVINFLIG